METIDKLLSCMKINRHILTIALILGILIPIHFAYAQNQASLYSDVGVGHSEYVAIKYLSEKGIINGYADGSFKPKTPINRVEALKIILKANNLLTKTYIKDNGLGGINFAKDPLKFTDIYKSMWYYPYLKKGVELGVIQGYTDGTFKPAKTVNRVESFKMIMQSDGITLPDVTENPFDDVHSGQWFAPYILEAKIREIIYVTMQNKVNPNKEMTRSKFAELVYRYIRSKDGHKFGKASYYSDYLEGHGTSSGEPYKAAELTAANLTLPFGTIVKVTNLANGESVNVKINDRGPYVTGRSLDLSKTAFKQIASLGSGIIWIEYETVTQE